MIPNLIEATRRYWRQLDQIEAAYRSGELSAADVDAQVQQSMAELGQARRETLRLLGAGVQHLLSQSGDLLAGAVCISLLAYLWLTVTY
ncbi:hypothetical protein XM38_040480 [Halomicronema hongdechloris C2206]|uniref:Uncharacterized protein n=1 Tax=Halomicronema hongdechloris C2206 TaxID=1641165 RepID=A0A1Z3HS39_9CYAN|nr:hypothetical protein [Halomicronema hongdechloris]ASC73086.1 hypothetical protein XM38_040480 [Halomicronema hongdechloris C2206]